MRADVEPGVEQGLDELGAAWPRLQARALDEMLGERLPRPKVLVSYIASDGTPRVSPRVADTLLPVVRA